MTGEGMVCLHDTSAGKPGAVNIFVAIEGHALLVEHNTYGQLGTTVVF